MAVGDCQHSLFVLNIVSFIMDLLQATHSYVERLVTGGDKIKILLLDDETVRYL